MPPHFSRVRHCQAEVQRRKLQVWWCASCQDDGDVRRGKAILRVRCQRQPWGLNVKAHRNQPNQNQSSSYDLMIEKSINKKTHPRLLGPPSAVLPGMSTDDGSHGQRRAYQLGGPKERKHDETQGGSGEGVLWTWNVLFRRWCMIMIYVGTVYMYIYNAIVYKICF